MADNERSQDNRGPEENLRTAANAVTLTRLVVATFLFAASAYLREPVLNLTGLAVYWLGDVADGFLARRLNQETLFGAQLDILADRMSVAFFYLNYLVLYPSLAPVIVLFLVQFMVVDHYLSNQYLRWPIMSPNYFYRVDHRIWALNWSKLGKACNTGLVTLLLLATKSNAVVLPVVLVLLAVKLYSCARVARLHEPIVRLHEPRQVEMPAIRQPTWSSKHTLAVSKGGKP
jgi:CDP-diacylglycerol--glycerol-3-phosphate 3-phosphatidyltransferase